MWWNTFRLIFVVFVLLSCDEQTPKQTPTWTKEDSTSLNRELALQEAIDIRLFVERQSALSFDTTGSGLHIAMVVDSVGPVAVPGQKAYVHFRMSMLDGTLCYENSPLKLNAFNVDRSDIETGVQEAIKHMSVGDSARIVVPSHLGHGLTGDMRKIPPLTPLVIDLKLHALR